MQNHAFIKKNRQNGQFATLVVENQVKSSFGKGVALVIAALALAFACLDVYKRQVFMRTMPVFSFCKSMIGTIAKS